MVCPPARDSKQVEEYCKELVIDVNPSDLPHAKWSKYCIYKVPKQLRKINEEAYTPKLVSIGPFHHIHPNDDLKDTEKYKLDLKDMEEYKLKYLDDFLKRERTKKVSQEDLLKIIEGNEKEIHDSYSEVSGLESGDFVKMILLDAVFIIELFLKDQERKEEREKELDAERKGENYCKKELDYMLSKPWLKIGVRHDLILLENQLPFFVIEKLYMFAFNDSSGCNHREEGKQMEEHKKDLKKEDAPFVKLSRNYFGRYDNDEEPKSIIGEEVKHFTDLLRYLLCPPHILESRSELHSLDIRYCATKLDDAGLKFKEVKGGRRLLDIQPPRPGVLQCFPCFGRPMEVPQLEIDDYTETLLRNLMALEQCHYPSKTQICNYVSLLDHLIDDDKDVDLLVHKKVIYNLLGSSKIVAELINKLCDHIVVCKPSYFSNIAQKVNDHYEYPLNRTWATLKRVYFPNVFRGTATFVALIVLFFTIWNFFKPLICRLELKYMCYK